MKTDIFEEYIWHEQSVRQIKDIIGHMIYNWLTDHYTLYDSFIPTSKQIGALYIGPNNTYKDNESEYDMDDFRALSWGWSWIFTNNYKAIKIQFNTIKNEWQDVKEDNEVIVSFEDLLTYYKGLNYYK